MSDDRPAPGKILILHPSRVRWLLMLALSVGFAVIGSMILARHPWIGGAGLAFFGLCALVAIVSLLPGANHLRLHDDGFEMRSLFRSHHVAWRDVATFGVSQIALNRMVGWQFASGHAGQERLRKVNAGLSGFEAALPDTYGRKAQALADLMNAWRVAAMTRPDA